MFLFFRFSFCSSLRNWRWSSSSSSSSASDRSHATQCRSVYFPISQSLTFTLLIHSHFCIECLWWAHRGDRVFNSLSCVTVFNIEHNINELHNCVSITHTNRWWITKPLRRSRERIVIIYELWLSCGCDVLTTDFLVCFHCKHADQYQQCFELGPPATVNVILRNEAKTRWYSGHFSWFRLLLSCASVERVGIAQICGHVFVVMPNSMCQVTWSPCSTNSIRIFEFGFCVDRCCINEFASQSHRNNAVFAKFGKYRSKNKGPAITWRLSQFLGCRLQTEPVDSNWEKQRTDFGAHGISCSERDRMYGFFSSSSRLAIILINT